MSQLKMLVVEDSVSIAGLIEKIGLSLGFEVTVVETLAALKQQLAESNDYFVATIDYALPDAENGEAIPYVLENGIPGVVMTGKMDLTTRQQILQLPVIDYIAKENSQAFLYLKRILSSQLTNQSVEVLVVDDSHQALNHVESLLKRRNFKTYTAANGVEALNVLSEHPDIKLVITDHEMPEMDGITLTTQIRKLFERNSKIIIGISGASNGIHSARFIKNGADDFLRKPFCPEEFYCRVMQNMEMLGYVEEIKNAANTDYLTKLANRRHFFAQVDEFKQQKVLDGKVTAVVLGDIDFFKKINDDHGHDVGDVALKLVASVLNKHTGNDLLARFGGEEFVILMAEESKTKVVTKVENLRQQIEKIKPQLGSGQLAMSMSFGVCFIQENSIDDCIKAADKALYEAKSSGRNCIRFAE